MEYANNLIAHAKSAADNAYAPYSGFKVGAALLCADGSIYLGCNIENSSYSATICAERVALQSAVAQGKRDFIAIAIAGGREAVGENSCPPCGICRQVLSEFCNKDFKIILANSQGYNEYTLSEMLPHSFSKENL